MKVHEEHKKHAPKNINFNLIIVSTSRYNELKSGVKSSDKTIPIVQQLVSDHPDVHLLNTEIVADDEKQIKEILNKYLNDSNIDAMIFSGGTGLSPKDITFETIEPLLQKQISGFGELFRYLSYKEIGSSAMLSRAVGGLLNGKLIFLLPGSPNAVKLAMKELILPELGHIIYLIHKKE